MKKPILILLACSSVLLAGCASNNPQEEYAKAKALCTMTWYDVYASSDSALFYDCKSREEARDDRFWYCAWKCDEAIDDNRDLTLQNSSTETVACLNLCMWE